MVKNIGSVFPGMTELLGFYIKTYLIIHWSNFSVKQIIKNFYVDLPKGAVFINDDGRGNKLFDGLGTYIIKGISLHNNFGQGN